MTLWGENCASQQLVASVSSDINKEVTSLICIWLYELYVSFLIYPTVYLTKICKLKKLHDNE